MVGSGTAIFFSDVHLKDSASVKTKLVLRFLQEKASQFQKIYLLGDVFDVWPGTNPYLIREFQPVLDTLRGLVRDGHEVHYLEGNHDFRLGSYFANDLGIRVYEREIIETWAGKRIYMAHGDLGNPKQLGYRALRYLLRHDSIHWLANRFPPETVYWIGKNTSQLSRDYRRRSDAEQENIRQIYRKSASGLFTRGYDIVIMGHTHIPDDYRETVGTRECRYLNSGDWVQNFTYLEFDGKEFHARVHPVVK